MERRIFRWLSISATITLCALIVIAGCTAPTAPVGKQNRVVMYGLGDVSGLYASASLPIFRGWSDYNEWLNAEKGGIRGVPQELVTQDTGGKLDVALATYSRYKQAEPKPFLLFTFGSDVSEALRDRVVEDEIAHFTMGASTFALYPAGYTFSTTTSYVDLFGGFIDWVASDWAKKTGQKVKVAILTWDSSLGRAIMMDEARQFAASKGVEIVAEEVFGARDADVSTQLTKIKAKGANWVYDNTVAHGSPVIHKSAKALGMLNQNLYDTTPGMIHRASGPWGAGDASIRMAPEESEGAISATSIILWSEMANQPGLQLIDSVMANKEIPEWVRTSEGYIIGWIYGAVMAEVTGRAVDAVGWDKLDGSAIKDQFVKMKDYRPFDLCVYNYTADKPEPRGVRIVQVQGGKGVPITDWFNCPDLKPVK